MSAEVLSLSAVRVSAGGDIRMRLGRVVSILKAIDAGELLAAFPECAIARRNHLTALDLLSIVEAEVDILYAEFSEC